MAKEVSDQQPAAMRFPRDINRYVLTAAIGTADSAAIYRAKHVNPTTGIEIAVGIKIVNLCTQDIYFLTKEVHEAATCDHENMVKVHCYFKIEDHLWIVISPLFGFSLRCMIRSSFPNGLPDNTVFFILKEVLRAVNYMHEKNKLHKDIGADCIFLDEKFSTVKLSLPSLKFENPDSSLSSDGFPNWIIPPELMNDCRRGGDKATDIWMFGSLALELFYGRIPAYDFEEFQLLVKRIEDQFGMSKRKGSRRHSGILGKFRVFSHFTKKTKKIPEALGEVMAACLAGDPKKRPTANQLMEFDLFRKCSVGQESLKKLKQHRYGTNVESN